MKKKIIMLILSMSLAGCATNWTHSYKSDSQFQQDAVECNYQAMISAPPPYGASTAMVMGSAMARYDIINQCLRMRGYYKVGER